GMDSIGATKIATHLNETLGLQLSGALFMELNSAAKLMEHLRAHAPAPVTPAPVAPAPQPVAPPQASPQPQAPATPSAPTGERAAIIGYDARLPGAGDVDSYWDNVQRKAISIAAVPATRWKERGVATKGKDTKEQGDYASMQHAALIEDIDAFDPAFWGIDEAAARAMDPQERLLLKSIWHCVEHAGIAMKDLTRGRVGLFLTLDSSDYQVLARARGAQPDTQPLMSVGMIANRISYYCNFTGPSEAIDNACASTYVALKRAAQALASGECDSAIVGGAKILLDPAGFRGRDEGEILSRGGRMYPFDARADGYVRGEGVGCVLLKNLEQASRDGDTIHAVVAGVGVTHNGRGALSQVAPSVDGQYRAIRAAYRAAGVSPASVSYIEAHGTSNSFSDAAEFAAFKQFFKEELGQDAYRAHRCAVSTVKANIGHLEGASGIASLLKAVCAIRDRKIAPTATWSTLHPSILLDKSPFWLPTELTDWQAPAGAPLRMGLHSIGIGGVNAHVILEEGTAQAAPMSAAPAAGTAQLVLLSAKSPAALEALRKDWHAQVAALPHEGEEGRRLLADLAYSSRQAREPMACRAAYVVSDLAALKAALALPVEQLERQ
ncbi:MAG: beta-ketoacyl synthase N-terminal-like domain-containing protein, partial [Gammaproteobacteria bacterium]